MWRKLKKKGAGLFYRPRRTASTIIATTGTATAPIAITQKPNPMAPKTMAAAIPPTTPAAYVVPRLAILDRGVLAGLSIEMQSPDEGRLLSPPAPLTRRPLARATKQSLLLPRARRFLAATGSHLSPDAKNKVALAQGYHTAGSPSAVCGRVRGGLGWRRHGPGISRSAQWPTRFPVAYVGARQCRSSFWCCRCSR